MNSIHIPDSILIQWHITDECNYRCKHCYQNNFTDKGVDYNLLLQFLDNIDNLIKYFSSFKKIKAHLNFTGGEPFLKENFLDLLKEVKSKKHYTFGILSNGFLLNADELQQLKVLKPEFVQISMDGNEKSNDMIRGKASFKQIINAFKTYKDLHIPVIVSFTANKLNYKDFPDVVKIARKYKVKKVWTDRYLPINKNDALSLSSEELKAFFQLILKEQQKKTASYFSDTLIASNRSLQFLVCGGRPYSCSAGDKLLAILPDGDVLPCRRMPVVTGNLKRDSLIDIYLNNKTLLNLRQNETSAGECSNCYYKNSCKGGLKCMSYALYNDFNRKDPDCWI